MVCRPGQREPKRLDCAGWPRTLRSTAPRPDLLEPCPRPRLAPVSRLADGFEVDGPTAPARSGVAPDASALEAGCASSVVVVDRERVVARATQRPDPHPAPVLGGPRAGALEPGPPTVGGDRLRPRLLVTVTIGVPLHGGVLPAGQARSLGGHVPTRPEQRRAG